jgi:hypothetical protein
MPLRVYYSNAATASNSTDQGNNMASPILIRVMQVDSLSTFIFATALAAGQAAAFEARRILKDALVVYFALFEIRSFHSSKTPGFKATAI